MPRLPRLPRRRRKWQRIGIKTARNIGELVAWFGIGFAAVATADTAPRGSWLYTAIFMAVVTAGVLAMKYGRRTVSAIRRGRTPERHRHPSNPQRVRNQSIRNLSRRFRRG